MKYKISAPNGAYTGISAGIPFVNGTAVVEDDKCIDWFKSKGYAIELLEGQSFVVDGNEIGKVEGDYITITDPNVIKETVESDECIKSTISEIKAMKAEQLIKTAEELGVDISTCKKVEEKRDAIIAFITAKNAATEENVEIPKVETENPEGNAAQSITPAEEGKE